MKRLLAVRPALLSRLQPINAPDNPVMPKHTVLEERLNIPTRQRTGRATSCRPLPESSPGPAVLVVHGGGWEGRSRADMTDTARELARHGFTTMNIDYRFAPQHQYPAQLHDLQRALDWLRQNHGELNIDPERIAGFGYSSGAHLVSLLATVTSNDHPDQAPESRPAWPGGRVARACHDLRTFDSGRLGSSSLATPEACRALPARFASRMGNAEPPTCCSMAGPTGACLPGT